MIITDHRVIFLVYIHEKGIYNLVYSLKYIKCTIYYKKCYTDRTKCFEFFKFIMAD